MIFIVTFVIRRVCLLTSRILGEWREESSFAYDVDITFVGVAVHGIGIFTDKSIAHCGRCLWSKLRGESREESPVLQSVDVPFVSVAVHGNGIFTDGALTCCECLWFGLSGELSAVAQDVGITLVGAAEHDIGISTNGGTMNSGLSRWARSRGEWSRESSVVLVDADGVTLPSEAGFGSHGLCRRERRTLICLSPASPTR